MLCYGVTRVKHSGKHDEEERKKAKSAGVPVSRTSRPLEVFNK